MDPEEVRDNDTPRALEYLAIVAEDNRLKQQNESFQNRNIESNTDQVFLSFPRLDFRVS